MKLTRNFELNQLKGEKKDKQMAAIGFFQFINENKKKSKMKLTRNFELNQLKGGKKDKQMQS